MTHRDLRQWRPRTFRDWCAFGLVVVLGFTLYVLVSVLTGLSLRTALRDSAAITVLICLSLYAEARWRRRGRS